MANHMETDSLQLLIHAVAKYREALAQNYKIILDAANACDAIMGNDTNAQKHIGKLIIALGELQKTAALAESVQCSLTADLRKAIDTTTD